MHRSAADPDLDHSRQPEEEQPEDGKGWPAEEQDNTAARVGGLVGEEAEAVIAVMGDDRRR